MIRVEGAVEVERPADRVFEFLSRVENYPSWQPGIEKAERTSPGPVQVGTTMRLVFRGPSDTRIVATAEVTECTRPERFAYRTTSGPAKVTGTYDFQPTPAGTRVAIRTEVQPTGALRLLEGKLAPQVKAEFPVSLLRLKRALEAQRSDA